MREANARIMNEKVGKKKVESFGDEGITIAVPKKRP